MSLAQLRTVVEVYRQSSISRAAAELGLTQPAVSQHVASLEAQLGRQLFIRHARGVQPTALAEDLVRRVAEGLDRAEAALAELRARSTRLAGTLHLCGPSDILSELIAPRLRALIDNNLSLRLHPVYGDGINRMLLEGGADFGFGVEPATDPRLDAALVGTEELLLTAPPELARRISGAGDLVQGLSVIPFVAYERGRALIRRWLDHNGIDIGHAEEVVVAPDLRGLRELVVQGFGWSVLPRFVISSQLETGQLRALSGQTGNPQIPYHMRWQKSALRNPRNALARTLILEQFGL